MPLQHPSRREMLEAHRAYGPKQRATQFTSAPNTLVTLLGRRGRKIGAERLGMPVSTIVEEIQGIVVTRSLYEDILSTLYFTTTADSTQQPPTATTTDIAADDASSPTAHEGSAVSELVDATADMPISSTALHVLLHQQASYFRMLTTEADTAFLTLLDRWWHLEDLRNLDAAEERARYWVTSDETSAMKTLTSTHRVQLRDITNDATRRGMVASESSVRDEIEDEEESRRNELKTSLYHNTRALNEKERRAVQLQQKAPTTGSTVSSSPVVAEERPFKVDLPEAVVLTLQAEVRERILHAPAAPPTTAPTTSSRPSRMAQYKEARRYRQDVDYRTAIDTARQQEIDKAKADAEETAIHGSKDNNNDDGGSGEGGAYKGGGTSSSSGKGGLSRMVEQFASPPGWDDAVLAVVHAEYSMRSKLQTARYQWTRTLMDAQRRYLEACALGKPMGILKRAESKARTTLHTQYVAMLMEFTEALETLHRKEIQQSIAPRAAKTIDSTENSQWLISRRKENARKDEEERKGADEDFRRRGEHFTWERDMLLARLSLGKEETHVRVNTLIKSQRREMMDISELFDLELPIVLIRAQHREAKEWQASTIVTWTQASYNDVYLGEVEERDTIAATQLLESQRLHKREVKEFLAARRQELINADVMSKMAEYDRHIHLNPATNTYPPPSLH